MSNPIFIARQDTLDEKIIPAQLLNDYKLHGEYSFVFHTPELWHKMCTHAYAANDQKVNGDALEYVLTKAAPTGSYSLSNWMALLCDTAEQAAKGLYAGIETAGQLAQSSAAMAAVSNSETAMNAVAASTTAMDALYARKKNMSGGSASKSGKFIILEISANNAFDTSKYGYATLSDGSKPNWGNYLAKYAFFKQYPKYATYMRNDTDSDDYIYYFDITNP